MSICQELEELYPAYVLDAVDEKEKKRIEAHMATCHRCSEIVAGYCSVADQLPYALPMVEPPADLKYRVLQAALPRARAEEPSASVWQALVEGFGKLLRSPALSAVTLLLVVALGIWNVSLQNQVAQQIASNQQMAAEMSSERAMMNTMAYADAQPKRLESTSEAPQAIGRLFMASDLNALALIVYDMPTLKPDQVYQIWLIDPKGNRTSGGTFAVDAYGRGWVYIRSPQPLSNYQGIGITMEPMGGSPAPTGPKMMGTSL